MSLSPSDLAALWPVLIPAVVGCVLPIAALDRDQETQKWIRGAMFVMALAALAATFFYTTRLWVTGAQPTVGVFRMDRLAQFATLFLAVAGALGVMQLWDHLHQEGWVKGEALALLLLSLTGMILFSATTHLLLLFVALELLSIPLYVLTGFVRMRPEAPEGGLKYFLTGAVASATFLMGGVLLYGVTGSLDLAVVAQRLATGPLDALALAGAAMVLMGFLFKVGAVPFHAWVPDAYEAAPHPISGFMSAATKGAAFFALLRVFPWNLSVSPELLARASSALAVVAVLTLVFANLAALAQTNVKRLLAYASVGQAGYLLLAFVAGTPEAYAGLLFYLAAYMAMSLGAFGLLTALGLVGERTDLLHLRGQGWKRPELGIAAALCLFSMAGIPPLAGFYGKYQIFKELVGTGHLGLAILGVLASLVSVGYYLKVVVALFMEEPSPAQEREEAEKPAVEASVSSATVLVCGVLVVLMGLLPGAIYTSMSHRTVKDAGMVQGTR